MRSKSNLGRTCQIGQPGQLGARERGGAVAGALVRGGGSSEEAIPAFPWLIRVGFGSGRVYAMCVTHLGLQQRSARLSVARARAAAGLCGEARRRARGSTVLGTGCGAKGCTCVCGVNTNQNQGHAGLGVLQRTRHGGCASCGGGPVWADRVREQAGLSGRERRWRRVGLRRASGLQARREREGKLGPRGVLVSPF